MAGVYLTCALFVVIVLGGVLRVCGLSLIRFLRYIGEEILLVLGTSSSESALPRLMVKMERLGCSKPVVGLVVPAGYSFNLDGTAIYMSMAAIFLAQASGIDLSLREQLSILAILMLTSNGAAGVTGSGFITLAATRRRDPGHPSRRAGAAGRRRSLHVGGSRDHQPDRQRRGDRRDRPVGRCARPAARARRARRRGTRAYF